MYLLKHKDDTVAVIDIVGSDASGIRINEIVNNHLLPLCAQHDISNIEHWWKRRAAPASRSGIRQLLSEKHISSVHQFLLENLALSVTDCYWIVLSPAIIHGTAFHFIRMNSKMIFLSALR